MHIMYIYFIFFWSGLHTCFSDHLGECLHEYMYTSDQITPHTSDTQDAEYKLVADYLTPGANLNSGQTNGDYSYVDPGSEPGVWVYRVQEEDIDGKRMTLSQTIIEVPSNSDKAKTLVAGGLIVAFLAAATYLGQAVDPMNGIN